MKYEIGLVQKDKFGDRYDHPIRIVISGMEVAKMRHYVGERYSLTYGHDKYELGYEAHRISRIPIPVEFPLRGKRKKIFAYDIHRNGVTCSHHLSFYD